MRFSKMNRKCRRNYVEKIKGLVRGYGQKIADLRCEEALQALQDSSIRCSPRFFEASRTSENGGRAIPHSLFRTMNLKSFGIILTFLMLIERSVLAADLEGTLRNL